MARKKVTGADYLERYDGEMRTILGELIENAAKVNLLWASARERARTNPQMAFKELIDAEIALDVLVRIERTDALRRMRAAIELLDRELPDDDDDADE